MARNQTAIGVCILFSALLPASAQQKDAAADDELYQRVQTEFAEAYNRGDVAAMAAFFGENAIRITPTGIFRGRDAIRQDMQKAIDMGLHDYSVQRSVSRLEGNIVFNAGSWQAKLGDQAFHGYYSVLLGREGDAVKILEETVNVAAPAR
jgi:ketosteroid isomerase-like protein